MSKRYKCCVVTQCKNATFLTPEKTLIYITKNENLRKKWCKAMRRKDCLAPKGSAYCCSDPFDEYSVFSGHSGSIQEDNAGHSEKEQPQKSD